MRPSVGDTLSGSVREEATVCVGRRVRENPNKKDGDEHDDAENVVHMKDSKRQGFRRRQEDAGVSH